MKVITLSVECDEESGWDVASWNPPRGKALQNVLRQASVSLEEFVDAL